MRVLIMVLSSTKEPYDKLMQAQQRTWDSSYIPNVTTIYYYGGNNESIKIMFPEGSIEYNTGVSDEYEMMHWKFKKTLDSFWDAGWDYIFRTNSSTYVRKDKIYQFLKDKPREKYYAGVDGGGFASGTGAIISRDCAQILRDNLNSGPNPSEDTLIGTTLFSNGIELKEGAKRLHFNFAEDKILDADYYRCKSEKMIDGILDRSEDIKAFNSLFNHFNKNEISRYI